jgi:hypothetical protein
MNDEGEIEAIELPAVHTEILMIRGTESGDWYFDNGIGLFNGPWPSKEICLIEYYRREHAEKTGKLYITKERILDINATLDAMGASELKIDYSSKPKKESK